MKDTVKRIKRPITVWEKTFADDISDKVLVSRRYKELSELNKQSSLKVDKRLEQTPPQKGHTDGKPAHKNVQYPPPGDVRVTVTVGGCCAPIRTAKYLFSDNTECRWDSRVTRTPLQYRRDYQMVQPPGRTVS